eukprot:TRINITY_DN14815_c0_g1_i1.p1 TRINITY_DN14815_c0_g1~~TRINITY_DN14815_c0_g1_i1.p1  ORF type:complete len:125 (-),score=8.24 TRINITY_DN14815_c0_g1_i1:112-486(-)
MAGSIEDIGKAFVTHYYSLFDQNQRAQLATLYQNESMLTFENDKIQGREAIGTKLSGLPFQQVKHAITSLDCQPTPGNGILVFVCGKLTVDEGNILMFSQVFNLMASPSGGFFVLNDIFRLNYG